MNTPKLNAFLAANPTLKLRMSAHPNGQVVAQVCHADGMCFKFGKVPLSVLGSNNESCMGQLESIFNGK